MYDRVAHAMASLIFQAVGVEQSAATTMLTTIQDMKFFLRTAFGDSKDFAGSTIKIKTQGLGQGNGGAPKGWCVITITILRAHGKKGHGATLMAPVSRVRQKISTILFVNNNDLLQINMEASETIQEVYRAIQRAVFNWGKLLIAMRGILKPEKYFYHLINFQWTQKQGWQYRQHHKDATARITVPMPDRSFSPIQHRVVDDAQKTLGIIMCPSGNSAGSLQQMATKTQEWLDRLLAGQLHRKMMWVSIDCQLWPAVRYGLCCSMATLPELESCLLPLYRKMLPIGGIVRTSRRGLRQVNQGFYGAGFPHPCVKATVEQRNKLLMHYGCHTALGDKLQTLIELLLLDLGLSFQPFSVSYTTYGNWVTNCWVKRVWEKVDHFGFQIQVNNLLPTFPWEKNNWLMSRVIRKHQQVLFLSDILGASRRCLDKKYRLKRKPNKFWSALNFP